MMAHLRGFPGTLGITHGRIRGNLALDGGGIRPLVNR